MSVPIRHVLQQGPVIGALARSVLASARPRKGDPAAAPPATPGPEVRGVAGPLPPDLLRDYIRHVGGDPAAYRGLVPPHLFPQWVFPVASRTLAGVPYPLARAVNAGCRLEIRAPLPAGERLRVSAELHGIDDNGKRALIHQRVVTSTSAHPEALVAHLYALVPLQRGDEKAPGGAARRERPRVPDGALEIARLRLSADAGLDFAKLTGDFNPIHWIPQYAQAFGFRGVILHGFSTMARAFEGLARAHFSGDVSAIRVFDVRFTRPLLLPRKVGLYVHDKDRVAVGDAPGGPAYLLGTFGRELSPAASPSSATPDDPSLSAR